MNTAPSQRLAFAPARRNLRAHVLVTIAACLFSLSGCADEPARGSSSEFLADGGACPTGPEAPLGTACTTPGLECEYGYDPVECGGRTVACSSGTWVEVAHSDPQPTCMR